VSRGAKAKTQSDGDPWENKKKKKNTPKPPPQRVKAVKKFPKVSREQNKKERRLGGEAQGSNEESDTRTKSLACLSDPVEYALTRKS